MEPSPATECEPGCACWTLYTGDTPQSAHLERLRTRPPGVIDALITIQIDFPQICISGFDSG